MKEIDLLQIIDQRNQTQNKLNDLISNAEKETRKLNEDESKIFAELTDELRNLNKEIKNKEEILAALDMGSTNVTACVALKTEGKPLEIIGVGTTPSKGIKKGCVIDIESTAEAISAAVEAAEEMADVEINSVFVNIAGNHIKSFNSVGSVPITSEN